MRGPCGILGQGTVELLGLFFDKTPGAGCTDIIHDHEGHAAVLQGCEFSILPANLDDGIHPGVNFNRRPRMGRNFIDRDIGSDNFSDKFTTGTGGSGPADFQINTLFEHHVIHGGQQHLHGRHRFAGRAGVKSGHNRLVAVDQHRFGAGRSHVDTQVGGQVPGMHQVLIDVYFHVNRYLRVPGPVMVGIKACKVRIIGKG